MATEAELRQAAKDAADAAKAEKAYMGSLTSTEPAPKPPAEPKPAPTPKPKKMAKGGVTRADGCCVKGHTRGKMV